MILKITLNITKIIKTVKSKRLLFKKKNKKNTYNEGCVLQIK